MFQIYWTYCSAIHHFSELVCMYCSTVGCSQIHGLCWFLDYMLLLSSTSSLVRTGICMLIFSSENEFAHCTVVYVVLHSFIFNLVQFICIAWRQSLNILQHIAKICICNSNTAFNTAHKFSKTVLSLHVWSNSKFSKIKLGPSIQVSFREHNNSSGFW